MNSASGNKILRKFRGHVFSSRIRSPNSFFALEIMSGLSIVCRSLQHGENELWGEEVKVLLDGPGMLDNFEWCGR